MYMRKAMKIKGSTTKLQPLRVMKTNLEANEGWRPEIPKRMKNSNKYNIHLWIVLIIHKVNTHCSHQTYP